MGLSHWKDADSRVAYERAYASSLSLWPLPVESRHVTTTYGDTRPRCPTMSSRGSPARHWCCLEIGR